MQETWPALPLRNSDELWTLVSDAWDEVASSTCYIRLLFESLTRRMKSVVEAEGFWTPVAWMSVLCEWYVFQRLLLES